MSPHYAVGLIGGIGALLGGWILGFTAGLSGSILGLPLDPYLPLLRWACADAGLDAGAAGHARR